MYKLEKSKYRIPLIICLFIFCMMCIGTSLFYGNKLLLGSIEKYDNDDVKYLRSAKTLIETGKLTYNFPNTKTVFIMPGIILALAPFVAVFGELGGIVAFRIFSAILQTFTLFVIFLLLKKIFKSEKIAFLAVILNMLYISNIYVTTLLLSETIFTCLLINLIYICIFAVEEKSLKYYTIGGILWGLSVMFKPVMLAFPINILVLMLLNKYKFSEIIKYALLPIGIVLIFLMSWWIRNYVSFGKFIPLTLSSGNPKLQGAYIDYNQNPSYKNEIDFSDTGEYTKNEIEKNEVETKRANAVIKYNLKNNTLPFIYWTTIGKTIKNFNSAFLWYPIFNVTYLLNNYIHIAYVFAGILGILITILNKKYKISKEKYMLLSTIIFFNIIYLPYYCFCRYVYPIMPILIGFAGITIITVIEILLKKIRRKNEKFNNNTSL